MNTDQMMKLLGNHPIMGEIGMEMVMGFPFFEVCSNTLHVYFLLHREHLSGERIAFFRPAYRMEFVFPFRHLCRFDNLVLEGVASAGLLAHCEEGAEFKHKYESIALEVHRHSDRILQEAAMNGCPTAEGLTEYNRVVFDAIHTLGLSDVYDSEAK